MAHVSSPPAGAAHKAVRVRSDNPTARLVLAAGAIAVLFGAFLVGPMPIWAGHPSGPPASGANGEPVGWPGVVLMLAFMLAVCLPFRPYHLAQRAAQRASDLPLPLLVGITIMVALVAVLIYPAYGSDIFDYAGFERMWVVYGDNPLLALPITRPEDWATQFVWYPDRTPAYGPLWAILTWPLVKLAGASPATIVAGYKILSICAYATCCWLIWQTLDPARRRGGLVYFAWSPLILFEVLGKVHNDVLPALAMLAMIWLLAHPRTSRFSVAAVVAGGLVKITALAAAPPVLVYLWRRGAWRAIVPALALGLLLLIMCYAPFWAGAATVAPIWHQTSRVIWSPASLLIVASAWLPGGPYPTLVRVLIGLAWVALCAGAVLRPRLDRAADVAASSGWVLVTSVLLLTSAVYAHYFIPAVALAAVSHDERLQQLVFWLSLGGLAAYSLELLGLALGPDWLASDGYRVIGTLTLLGPAALMVAARRGQFLRRSPG